jgi:hypothetical protein
MDKELQKELMQITDYMYQLYKVLKSIEDPMMRLHVINSAFLNTLADTYGPEYIETNIDMISDGIKSQLLECAQTYEERCRSLSN